MPLIRRFWGEENVPREARFWRRKHGWMVPLSEEAKEVRAEVRKAKDADNDWRAARLMKRFNKRVREAEERK